MKVSVIIPVHNQVEYTKLCLESISNNSRDTEHEVIVIDNNSTDATPDFLRNAGVKVITNAENAGVAKAWNAGVNASSGKYLCIINNDIIAGKNWLSGLVEFYEKHPDAGIVSPATREGAEDYGVDSYSEKLVKKLKNVSEKGFFGWVMMIKKDRLEKYGLFSEEFEVGIGEDTDYALRLLKSGLKNYITGASFVHHFGSATIKGIRQKSGNEFEKANIKILNDKWGIKQPGYLARKAESFIRNSRRLVQKIISGHSLYEKS